MILHEQTAGGAGLERHAGRIFRGHRYWFLHQLSFLGPKILHRGVDDKEPRYVRPNRGQAEAHRGVTERNAASVCELGVIW